MTVRPLIRADWPALRDVRLRALRTEPGVFTSTYERECGKTDDEWQSLADGNERHQMFGLFDGDRLAGISGIYAPADDPDGTTVFLVMSYIEPE
ncbi:MAG: hypothetical protein ABR591_12515 [Candidatus Velthaea sp.]